MTRLARAQFAAVDRNWQDRAPPRVLEVRVSARRSMIAALGGVIQARRRRVAPLGIARLANGWCRSSRTGVAFRVELGLLRFDRGGGPSIGFSDVVHDLAVDQAHSKPPVRLDAAIGQNPDGALLIHAPLPHSKFIVRHERHRMSFPPALLTTWSIR